MTVTQVDTVQHSSPCPLDPEPSPDVCVNSDNNEGRMDPKLEELEPASAGTGLKTPGQQCPPNEGIWEQGRTTANGFLTAGVDSSQGGRISSPTESVGSTPVERWKRREGPPWNAAVTLLPFSAESWKAPCCASCFVAALCVLCFPNHFCFPGDHFSAKLKDMRGDADQGSSR